MFDIRQSPLRPHTLGEWIDALIIQNLRMWHEQELVYDIASLEGLDEAGLRGYLRRATWINLERNTAMDQLDARMVADLFPGGAPAPAPRGDGPAAGQQIWERA